MPYAFRLCFEFSGQGLLASQEEHVDFEVGNPPRKMRFSAGHVGARIAESQRFVISGRAFSTADEAGLWAENARLALLMYGIRHRVGVDLGKHRPRQFSISEHGKQILARQFQVERVMEDHLGITIYPTDPMPKFIGIKAQGRVSSKVHVFVDHLIAELGHVELGNERVDVAAELYGLSHFVARAPGKLLVLVASLEALLQPVYRNEVTRAHVDRLMRLTRESGIEDADKQAMLSQLGYLQYKSIGQSGKAMAAKLLVGRMYHEVSAADFFLTLYRVRSDLLHKGNVDSDALHVLVAEADRFVSDIFQAHFLRT